MIQWGTKWYTSDSEGGTTQVDPVSKRAVPIRQHHDIAVGPLLFYPSPRDYVTKGSLTEVHTMHL